MAAPEAAGMVARVAANINFFITPSTDPAELERIRGTHASRSRAAFRAVHRAKPVHKLGAAATCDRRKFDNFVEDLSSILS